MPIDRVNPWLYSQCMDKTYTKTCKHCQTVFQAATPRTSYCSTECRKIRTKADKAEYDRKRYEADPQAVKDKVSAWKKENRERVNEQARAEYADPVRGAAYRARIERYTEANREVCEERWAKNTQRRIETGEHQALCGRRRNRIAVNTPDMTEGEKAKMAQLYRVARLLAKRYGIAFDVDHIIPLSKGGEHHPRNMRVITASENRSKGAKLLSTKLNTSPEVRP